MPLILQCGWEYRLFSALSSYKMIEESECEESKGVVLHVVETEWEVNRVSNCHINTLDRGRNKRHMTFFHEQIELRVRPYYNSACFFQQHCCWKNYSAVPCWTTMNWKSSSRNIYWNLYIITKLKILSFQKCINQSSQVESTYVREF